MKRLLPFLFVSAFCILHSAFASDLVISNNAIIPIFGDSLMADTSGAPSTGYRFPYYVASYFEDDYPGSNILCVSISGSGREINDVVTNGVHPYALPIWGYQSNNFQHIGILQATDNAGLSSNLTYVGFSNVFKAPAIMSDGNSTLNAQTGWAATHPVQWIGFGDPPANSSDGGPTQQARSIAAANAGNILGVQGIDCWAAMAATWIADIVGNAGANIGFFPPSTGGKVNHIDCPGELDWTLTFLSQFTHDTNISTAVVDWNTTSPVATNHCTISAISKSGNTLTFIRHDDRLPLGWDAPNAATGIINDCSPAFVLNPSHINLFWFSQGITNLPVGNYNVFIDGVLCAALTNTAFAGAYGWNMFTNMSAGPYAAARAEGLGRLRDRDEVDRITLIPASGSGNGHSMVTYGSAAFTLFQTPGNRGNTLIAAMNNYVADVVSTNTWASAAVLPTNHTFSISQIMPRYLGAHR